MIDIIISEDMIPVLVTLFVIALVTLITIAYSAKQRFFLPVFVLIPAVFMCVYISWATVSNLLGFPVATAIPDRSIYIAHAVNEEDNTIYVWAKAPKDSKPRLYEIPKTDNNEKQMKESKKRTEEGVPQVLKGKGDKKEGAVGRTRGGDYQRYDFNVGHEQFKYSGSYTEQEVPQLIENMEFEPAPTVPDRNSTDLPPNVP